MRVRSLLILSSAILALTLLNACASNPTPTAPRARGSMKKQEHEGMRTYSTKSEEPSDRPFTLQESKLD